MSQAGPYTAVHRWTVVCRVNHLRVLPTSTTLGICALAAVLWRRYERAHMADGRRINRWCLVDQHGSAHLAVIGIERDTKDGHYTYSAVSGTTTAGLACCVVAWRWFRLAPAFEKASLAALRMQPVPLMKHVSACSCQPQLCAWWLRVVTCAYVWLLAAQEEPFASRIPLQCSNQSGVFKWLEKWITHHAAGTAAGAAAAGAGATKGNEQAPSGTMSTGQAAALASASST